MSNISMESYNISTLMNFIKMKFGRRNKYSRLWLILLIATLFITSIKGVTTFSTSIPESNVEPFMGAVSSLKGDLVLDHLEDFGDEFNLKSEEKVELNLGTVPSFSDFKQEVNFNEEFKNATSNLTDLKKTKRNEEEDRENEVESEVEQKVSREDLEEDREEDQEKEDKKEEKEVVEEETQYKEKEKTENVEEDKEDREKDNKESSEKVQDTTNSRRVLKLNLDPSVSAEESSEEPEDVNGMFKDKMLNVIDSMRRLKKEIIEKNMELDNLFLEIDQLRMVLNKEENRVYKTLFKDVESLTKDLNLLRKGNIYYNGDSYNILNNITIMEALHGLYVIYRTPFILLRHNFKVYASFEVFLYKLFKDKIPKFLRSVFGTFTKMFRNFMNFSYGNTLKFSRVMYIYHSVNSKTMRIYDTLLSDFLRTKLQVDVGCFGYAGSSPGFARLGVLLAKFKVLKHYKYLRHSLFGNHVISASFLNRNSAPSMESNPDFLYIKHKEYKMLEVLYHIYRLKLYCFGQRLVLLLLRYLSLFCNLFVKDSLKSINTYTKPMFNLREDSLFRVRNLYLMLRSVSIMTLQRVDVFMDYCFNYANKLNPELSILVPKDLSNRIFFISVIILLTFLLVFVLQLLFHSLLGFFNSVFLTRSSSKSRLQSRFRHWYHRSFLRHFIHLLKRGFTHKPHKKKHKYHRNFESYHRVIDDGGVTNSDNYKQFKHSHKNT